MYCRNCGAGLYQGAAACSQCNVPAGSGNRFCPQCGNPAQMGVVNCSQCRYVLFYPAAAPIQQAKSKLTAGLLGILIGSLGVHNFYLGYTTKAVIQLLLTVIGGWFFGLGALAAWIWSLIEGIMILTGQINTDANGQFLGE